MQLNKLTEDDVEAYLTTFKQLMQGYSVERSVLARIVSPSGAVVVVSRCSHN